MPGKELKCVNVVPNKVYITIVFLHMHETTVTPAHIGQKHLNKCMLKQKVKGQGGSQSVKHTHEFSMEFV
jgi:hypothetical protein